jgi:hypothetical protein
VTKQGVVLEDEPDAATLHGHVRGVFTGELDLARVGDLQPGDDASKATS